MPPAEGKDNFLALERRLELQEGAGEHDMAYGGITHAVRSARKAKWKQGTFFRIMSNSLRKEIFAHFGAGCNTTGTVGKLSSPLFLLFSIFLH